MARPRIFVSSTFYDLKQIRADLEVFIRDLGYEPVLNERGSIPYGSTQRLEDSAYREVELADVLVSIVGGRFGSKSAEGDDSISQRELESAIQAERQVYIFIERAVQVEYSTYLLNKGNPDVRYTSVDNIRVFEFLEKVEGLPRNNAIFAFETAAEITDYLREQWAGLFQNLLTLQRGKIERQNLAQIERTANTLERLLKVTAESSKDANQLAKDVILSSHPAFAEIQRIFNLPYRVFFTTREELDGWLRSALNFSHEVAESAWDDAEYAEWYRGDGGTTEFDLLTVYEGIFDDSGSLRPTSSEGWKDEWVSYREVRPVAENAADGEKG